MENVAYVYTHYELARHEAQHWAYNEAHAAQHGTRRSVRERSARWRMTQRVMRHAAGGHAGTAHVQLGSVMQS